MRLKQHAVMLVHHGSIGKDDSASFLQAIGLMDVAEKMYPWTDCLHTREKFIGAVMDASVPVEDSVWRGMGNQHIHAVRNHFIKLLLESGTTVLHKHGNPIECHAVYLHRTVAQIMAIGVKSVNDGTIQACVVVPRHENLMGIGKCAEPPHKVQHLRG